MVASALILVLNGAARAQGVAQLKPLFGLTQVYDSNLFSTPTDRQADIVTRVTPGVVSEYRSARLTLLGRYAIDIERFADHAALTNIGARQHAAITFAYHLTPRTVLATDGELSKTQTPGELNAETALTYTRASARRVVAHASLTHQLNALTGGTLDYVFTDYGVAGGLETGTHAATVGIDRQLSPRHAVRSSYRLVEFLFGTSSVTSQALAVGWTGAITRRASLSIDGGPRVTNGSMSPDVSASVRYRIKPGELSLAYARTETTVIGLAGPAGAQSLTVATTWNLTPSLQLRVAPGGFRSEHDGRRADVYQLAVGLSRPIANGVSCDVTFDSYVQHGNLYAVLAGDTIPRRNVMVSLTAAPGIGPR